MKNANTWVKAAVFASLGLAVLGVWAYMAGGILLMAFDRPYEDATPLTLYQYWHYYGESKAVEKWLLISSGVSLAICLLPGLLFISSDKRSLFGDARFAKKNEIRSAGLFSTKGIVVGRYKGSYLVFDGSQHVIMSAPTRSGKGVGIVIPNLLTWSESVVVLDIKQENHAITSGFRLKHGHQVFLFNPAAADYKTHRYNPLAYLSDDQNIRIDDIQKIGNMLFPDQQGTDPIWTATPRQLFLGVVLLLLETPGKAVTLGQVLRETLVNGDGSKYFAAQINERAKTSSPLSGTCIRALNAYVSIASDNTRSGVMTSFRSRLELWTNPLVDAATSANDFDLRDVRKSRMSIYVGVTPDNLDRMAPLLNLFFQQLIDLNTRELPERNKALKFKCLILADEFTAMGKMDVLSKGISYIAGYGLRMMPIIQSPAQVVEVYGKEAAQTFMTNHALQIVFPPKASELQTAKDISDWLGYQTVKGLSQSRGKGIFSKKQVSLSESDQRRALLLPQEITSLGKEKELVVVEDCPPILVRKIRYYSDPVFLNRLKSVSPTLAALGNKLPNEKQLKDAVMSGELAAPIPFLDMASHVGATTVDAPTTVEVPSSNGGTTTVTVERPVTAADVPNLANLALKDFSVNFTAVPPTATGDAERDVAALQAYADNLCRDMGIAA